MYIKKVVIGIIISALFSGGCQSAQAWGRKKDDTAKVSEQPQAQQTQLPGGSQINFNVSVANTDSSDKDTTAVAVTKDSPEGESNANAYGYRVGSYSLTDNSPKGKSLSISDEISKNKPEEKSGSRKRAEAYNPFNLLATGGPVQMTCGSWN